jgi:ferrous iron transport protein B
MQAPDATAAPAVAVIGAESSGKSTLVSALALAAARAENVRGSTLHVERYVGSDRAWLDTPGVLHGADTATARATLDLLERDDDLHVLLVLRATHLDDELAALLPIVAGRHGAVAVTGWDRVDDTVAARRALASVASATGVTFTALDARSPGGALTELRDALAAPGTFTSGPVLARVGWRIEPPTTVLEHRTIGPLVGTALLLGPAVGAVTAALFIAAQVDPIVTSITDRLDDRVAALPWPLADVVGGDYGLLTMGPLLVVWGPPDHRPPRAPARRTQGLRDARSAHHRDAPAGATLRPDGEGPGPRRGRPRLQRACGDRDPFVLVVHAGPDHRRDRLRCRVLVPARGDARGARRRPAAGLVVPYLAVLLLGGLVHARLLTPRARRGDPAHLDLHLLHGRTFLVRPRARDVWREARTTLQHAGTQALPVFALITIGASLLATTGALDAAARVVGPLLAPLRLPAEVALPIVLASVRKDGALLLSEPTTLEALDGAQLLAALVLAGALVPCLVTSLTIARERGWRIAARLLRRQAAGALLLAAAVAWLGRAVLA